MLTAIIASVKWKRVYKTGSKTLGDNEIHLRIARGGSDKSFAIATQGVSLRAFKSHA